MNYKDDIDKYAKIWDAALEKGIFDDAPKPPQPKTDFYGQFNIEEEVPLNEVDAKYWDQVSKMAGLGNQYHEELSKDELKKVAIAVSGAHNPIMPQSVGKDQELKVTQNWGVGGKEIEQLEELKVRLEKLEGKLNALNTEESGKDTQSKIDSLKKQIDELSDAMAGDRFEPK